MGLQHRDFRLLWLGHAVSMTGTQMRIVAVTFQLYLLTRSPLSLGMLGLTQVLPLLAFGLPAGVAVDRLDRRRILLAAQLIMLLCSAALCALTWSGRASPLWIYGLLLLSAVAGTFDLPARNSLIPSLVPREDLPNALSLMVTAWKLAAVVGPMVSGLVIGRRDPALGIGTVYLIDALSFAMMFVAVLIMRHRQPVAAPDANAPSSLHAALDGLRFVFGSRLILSSMLVDFLAMFFGAANTMLPIFADQIIHVDAVHLGLLYASPSVGAVVAGLAMASYGLPRRQGRLLLGSVIVYGVSTALFGLSRWFIPTVLFLAGTGAADTVSTVIRHTIRQLNTPDEMRGRMTAVNMLFFVGGPQLGEVEAGLAAQWIGAGPSVVLGGLACVVCVLGIAARVPELRSYDR